MIPKNKQDLFIPEPIGDLLFMHRHLTLYYLEEVNLHREGQDIVLPEKCVIRKIQNPNFLEMLKDAIYEYGYYHPIFEINGIKFEDYEYKRTWAFEKQDLIRFVKSDYYLKHTPLIDETGEE